MLDQAFETLKTYDWGTDRKPLEEIDKAVIASHTDEAARKDLEDRLDRGVENRCFARRQRFRLPQADDHRHGRLGADIGRRCLSDKDLAHMSRFALERIPAPEAAQALRDALPKLDGALKIGVISSLGRAPRCRQRRAAGEVADRFRSGRRPCRRDRAG